MIRELHIEDFVVIERATVLFNSGLIAITGASGAGKSVLLSALSLACGARSESDVVRAGSDEARIDLRIETTNEDGTVAEHVLSRVVPRDGRSRAYIDGRPSTAFALAEMSSSFVEIHGQHEQHRLGNTRVRSDLLDEFGVISREATDRLAGDLAALKAEMATLGGTASERQREIDFLEYQLREIDEVSPQPDELVDLQTEEKLLGDVDRVRRVANEAISILDDDDDLRSLLRELEQVESFEESATRLDGVLTELSDIAHGLRSQVSELEEDPSRLSRVRERISSLKGLCRRYGETILEVLHYRDEIAEQSERLQHHDLRFQELEASLAVAEKEYLKAADDLRRERSDRAPLLAQEVNSHLTLLGMPYSRFDVQVDGVDGGAVDFLFSSNGSDELRTLGKVASGGETARCMLALDLAAGRRSGAMCTVFDEIDSGVDASAGEAIAHALKKAAEVRQIVVVTHLATVAAAADAHLVVTKDHIDGVPISNPMYVDDDAREQEIARMLTGSHDEESMTVARRLLDR
jgi:DNA repair protein RecN (Recombination protein N)